MAYRPCTHDYEYISLGSQVLTAEPLFQLGDAGCSGNQFRFGAISPRSLVVEGRDVPPGRRVVPTQLAMFPAQVQVEGVTVSLKAAVGQLLDWDGDVPAIY